MIFFLFVHFMMYIVPAKTLGKTKNKELLLLLK